MKLRPLTADEVEDFWAMNVSIEAAFVPDVELARALAESRVHHGVVLGGSEAFWHRAPVDLDREVLATTCIVVPPGQQADAFPFLAESDDPDVLWGPFRSGQLLRLAGAIPDARIETARAECARIRTALDARWRGKLRPRDHATEIADVLYELMDRIDELDGLDHAGLRFEIVRTLVQIAWDRPWHLVDVDAAFAS